QTPIYRIEPKYPKNLARKRKSGYAIIEFTVSTSGFVQDPKVLQSEGGKGFEKSALTAMKQWRYAPKFEKGIAVAGISTVRLDFTIN
ncbi:MAG: energy transducer TonB, partial [Gammaproteobacteria bacterium]|nr:energy transducer TonB [Gammaproteobacteria bacterium]